MNNYTLQLMTGIDFLIEECNLIIHQPTIKEISYFGEQNFFAGAQLLCLNKTMLLEEEQAKQITNFQLFIQIINEKNMTKQKNLVNQVLEILFPAYQIYMTPRSILFNTEGNNFIINEENFDDFQEVLKKILCLSQSGQDSFNPQGEKATEIAKKLQKAREKIAALNKQENKTNSAFSQYLSVITVGIGSMSLEHSINLTIYQLYDLVERYSLYINWDLDIRSRLAGAKAERPVENWMKSIH